MRANETDLNFEENIFIGLGSWPLTIVARLTILSEWNGTQTQNQLVHKRTLNLCSHLNFRYRACFEQGVPWQSGNYRVWIHSERRTWHVRTYSLSISISIFCSGSIPKKLKMMQLNQDFNTVEERRTTLNQASWFVFILAIKPLILSWKKFGFVTQNLKDGLCMVEKFNYSVNFHHIIRWCESSFSIFKYPRFWSPEFAFSCDSVALEILMDHKFQGLQEHFKYETFNVINLNQ